MNGPKDDAAPKNKLSHLSSLSKQLPPSKTGKVVWAWPQIVEALQCGWRMSEVWKALRNDGVDMPYNQFRVYVSRVRRRAVKESAEITRSGADRRNPHSGGPRMPVVTGSPPTDPYSAIRRLRSLKHRSGFEYDPFSTDKDLLK